MKPPRKILLATDLSARCDRAQDRAVSLTKHYRAELLVLHVIDAQPRFEQVRRIFFLYPHKPNEIIIKKARSQLLADISEVGLPVRIRIEEGVPHEQIATICREEECDLIVTGVSRNERLGRFSLGTTVGRLLRTSDTNILIITEKCRSAYQRIVVLVDFSDTSRRAVEAAAAYFPGQTITLLHSYKAPRASVAEDRINYTEQMRQAALHDLAAFLDSVNLTEDQRKYFGVMVEVGDEAKLLKDLVRLSDIELVVLGLRKRGLLVRALIGGSEKSVITANLCDVLVVR